MRRFAILMLSVAATFCSLIFSEASAQVKQDTSPQKIEAETIEQQVGETEPIPRQSAPSAAVVIKGKRLFVFYAVVDGLTPTERAERTGQVLRQIAEGLDFNPNKVVTAETPAGTDLLYGGIRIATVTTEDARIAQSSTYKLAHDFASKIRVALAQRIEETTASDLAAGIGLSVLATVILLLTIALISKIAIGACGKLESWRGTKIKAIKIQQAELIGANVLVDILLTSVKFSQIALLLLITAVYVLQVLNFFPRTRSLSTALAANAMAPIVVAIDATLEYLPSMFTLVMICLTTYAVISFARFFFDAIRDRTIHFADFDPDWAEPSYKLARFVIIAFALMVALPYLPGWESPAFKQVGLVLGVLVSLGSSGVVSNVMAGAVLTYTNAFKIGDRIMIGECTGDVVQKNLFVTKIRSVKNEVVSVPNGQILNSNVINYSTMGVLGQLILHTTVTIGYEEPYEKIEKLLVSAALETPGILHTPAPFMLQTSLDDYYVSYQVNAYTDRANEMQQIYSHLHAKIQDKFNEAMVEIMSPQFMSLRDGNDSSIPESYRGESYQRPTFQVTTKAGKAS
ncbi:mechanosensitive ion channel family protein [Candidatus Obscuribacterales bacterium]|nr:mechanosensitive ion channel family protein [Candidatus Obscuribacterales bacterium]